MNTHITNINNGQILEDKRYGKVIVPALPGLVPLHKVDVAYAVVDPGATSPAHFHERTEEVYAIDRGSGIVTIDGHSTRVARGDVVRIPRRAVHSLQAGDDGCEFWVSTSPPYSEGDDIETNAARVDRPSENVSQSATTIAVIVGTHRRGSISGKIARQVASLHRDLRITVDLIDLAELPESFFGSASYETRYDPTTPLARRLIAAQALHVLTPEYNGAYPAPLKHALDVVPYKDCFDGKPVALVGVAAGDWGGLRAVDQLQQVFAYRNAHVYGKRVYVKNVDEAPFDENGNLTDLEIVDRLRAQVSGFVDFVRRLCE